MREVDRLSLILPVLCLCSAAGAQGGCFDARVVARVPAGISQSGTTPVVYDSLAREEEGGTALYFCGSIRAILGGRANGIVRFDGTNWQGVGDDQHLLFSILGWSDSRPSGLSEVGGNLVVLGKGMLLNDYGFVRAASWDGAYWSPLDEPLATVQASLALPRFYDVAEHNSTLYAAAEGGVYEWDGGKWEQMIISPNPGFDPLQVRSYKGSLYVAGNLFSLAYNGGPAVVTGNVARFDGNTVSGIGMAAGAGFTRWMRVENDLLYFAGTQLTSPGLYGVLASWDGQSLQPLTPTGFGTPQTFARGFLLGDRTTILMHGSFGSGSVVVEATGTSGEITHKLEGFARTLDQLGGAVYASGEITSVRGEPAPLIVRVEGDRATSGIGGWQVPQLTTTLILSFGVGYNGGYALTSQYGYYCVPGIGSSKVAFTEDGVNFTPWGLWTDPSAPQHVLKLWGGDHGVVAYGTVRVPSGGTMDKSFTVWTGRSWSQVAQPPLPLTTASFSSAFFTAFGRAHVVCDGAAGAHIFALIGKGWVEVTPPIARERIDFAGQYGDTIALGGKFTNAAGQECPIAILKNDVWEFIPGVLGTQTSNGPRVLGVVDWGGEPLIAGEFIAVDGLATTGVAIWSGESWSRLGDIPTPFSPWGISDATELFGEVLFREGNSSSSSGFVWRFVNGEWDEVEAFRKRLWLGRLGNDRILSVGLTGDAGIQYVAEVLECSPCYADCDGSGVLDFFDITCFQNHFVSLSPEADCDQSGTLDAFDYLCFVEAFALGC